MSPDPTNKPANTSQTPIDIQPYFTENNADEARGELTMPTTYRLILMALSALALTGAAPAKTVTDQSTKGQSVEGKELSKIAEALEKANEAQKLDSGCKAGVDDRDSDLCAQWKAADAASKAACWAIVSIFITGLGTLGLFWQISLTRRAVQDTARATEAMNEANEIARSDQRPWIQIECVEATVCRDSTTSIQHPDGTITTKTQYNSESPVQILAKFKITNTGKSPAKDIIYWTKRLKGQWQKNDHPSICGENLRRFYFDKLENQSKILTTAIIPGESIYHSTVMTINESCLSDPSELDDLPALRALPRYAFSVQYKGIGLAHPGEVGRTFFFRLRNGDISVNPLSFHQDSLWDVDVHSDMRAAYIT